MIKLIGIPVIAALRKMKSCGGFEQVPFLPEQAGPGQSSLTLATMTAGVALPWRFRWGDAAT